jgi:hypothetical protein
LYSAASMLLRSMSAEAQSLASRPVVALASDPSAAAARARRPPEARLVRAPRGLKSHPQLRTLTGADTHIRRHGGAVQPDLSSLLRAAPPVVANL